jgi:hypothetical protein
MHSVIRPKQLPISHSVIIQLLDYCFNQEVLKQSVNKHCKLTLSPELICFTSRVVARLFCHS